MESVQRTPAEKRALIKRVEKAESTKEGCAAEGISVSSYYQMRAAMKRKEASSVQTVVYKPEPTRKKVMKKTQPVATDATQKLMLVYGDVEQIVAVFRGIASK